MRKPKVGDTVYVVRGLEFIAPLTKKGNCKVVKVEKKCFHVVISDYESMSFDIDSYADGAWIDTRRTHLYLDTTRAYVSEDVFNMLELKNKRIKEILRAEFDDMSCSKIQKIHTLIFGTPRMTDAEK
jgi:hypothetical protein